MSRGARTDARVDVTVAATCVVLALVLLILPDAPRDRIAGSIRGTVVSPLAAMQQRAALARRAFVQNDSVVRVVDSIIMRSHRLEEVEAENARLRDLLGLGRALRWGFVPAEALVGRGMGDEFTLVLSAGSQSGVERLSAVVAANGLVGMVQQVDATTSVAITWPHPEFRVSATSLDGAAFGIVTTHQGLDADGYLLELRGVPFRAQLRPGAPIISSGLGGVYPRGILIGTVLEELRSTAGWSRAYVVRPAVRPADVTDVLILSPDRNAEGVESVWLPAYEAQSRRVVAAGDSLARRAADSTAAATRKSVPDSAEASMVKPVTGDARRPQ